MGSCRYRCSFINTEKDILLSSLPTGPMGSFHPPEGNKESRDASAQCLIRLLGQG